MKHYLLIFCLLLSVTVFSQENGFKIRVHDKTHLSTKGEYSKKTLFPIKDKNINNITLNLYLACPEKGCSDWDYSISVILRKTKNGDTINYQLGRMITPYSGAYNQGDNAKTWNPSWSWDVSNYLPLLKDSVEIVVIYEGYQDGFLATTDFLFSVDKVNKKKVIKAENIHYGYFPYGNIEKPIDNYVTPKEITLPKGTKKVLARVTISGHGGDSTNAAAEFLKKEFYYKVNGKTIATQAIWKDDCGCNPIQPQGGTWIYNRAGWCPGTKVNEFIYDLTPYIKGDKAKVDIDFEYYKTLQIEQPGYQVAHDIFFLESDNKLKEGEPLINIIYYLPQKFTLTYKTNNDASRNKAYIIDKSTNNKVYERTQLDNNKEYNEKIELKKGYYNFLFTDSDCDGLSWWANREQGNGYVYIYNEDKTKLLEAFEPDFGCKIDVHFNISDNKIQFNNHWTPKLIKVPDTKAKTYTFVVFLKDGVEEELVLEIKDRKTKEVISKTTYPKSDRFQIVYDYSVLPKGSYDARVSTKTWSETRAFSIKD